MAQNQMPAVDIAVCSGWTENQLNLYNALPYYFAKLQVERRKTWTKWGKLTKKRKWSPNMGPIMRGVRKEPSPHLRQMFYPNPLSQMPKKDVMDVREVTQDAVLYRHRFESPALPFFPSFNDFMDHVDDHGQDIMEKIERAEDIFIRTNVFHMSPYMFLAQGNTMQLLPTAPWTGTGAFDQTNDGKSKALIAAQIQGGLVTSGLTLAGLNYALTVMETDLRVPFFKGSGVGQSNIDTPLDGKYMLMTDSETYNQFTFDPYLQQNKNCDLDVVNDSFRGSIFGRITCQLEDLPLRYQLDGTLQAPEVRVGNGYNIGETLPNPAYSLPDETGSPYTVSYLCGMGGYESLEVGPPPAPFSKDTPPENFPAMFWNGEVKITKQFLTQCADATTGLVVYEANTYGEYVKFISQIALGIMPAQRRNIIPILHKRKRGV
jgi:hypothetical protein